MINRLLPVIALLILNIQSSFAQIPNGSYENWTNGNPDSWSPNNFFPDLITVTSTTDAHDGSFALKGEVVSYNGGAVPPNVTPTSSNNLGFSITRHYVDLTGWYKSDLIGSNVGTVAIVIYHSSGLSIGYGFAYLPAAANYTRFTIPISYTSNYPAATAHITFSMADSTGSGFNVGSNFIIDALELEQITGVEEMSRNSMNVFPNPATAQINFTSEVTDEKKYFVRLYNVTGELVKQTFLESHFHKLPSLDINDIPDGIYELLIADDNSKNLQMQKILICRN
jgi:hypothetical protein